MTKSETFIKETTIEQRIEIVNEIIKEIATRGRRFFYSKRTNKTAFIFMKNGRLYMKNEDPVSYQKEDVYLHPKNGFSPRNFHGGGTLWGLTKDFKDYIQTGKYSNHNNGYGGLYCPHWGYPENDMLQIQDRAKVLGYL